MSQGGKKSHNTLQEKEGMHSQQDGIQRGIQNISNQMNVLINRVVEQPNKQINRDNLLGYEGDGIFWGFYQVKGSQGGSPVKLNPFR